MSKYRAILTDTLPYEVPVIFSNEKLFGSLGARDVDPAVRLVLDHMRAHPKGGVIPYNYDISKDALRSTTLSIIHPLWQLEVARFYERYGSTIVSYCGRSDYSLRFPASVTSVYSAESITENSNAQKEGEAQPTAEEGALDYSHIVSYFTYGGYTLLGKFMDSSEFINLEKRFSLLRTVDVVKCFYNLYTHTITWAVKERLFAKQHRNAFSFESEFDTLIQRANHSETNGIVVGPEVSRLFAEIILQDIDHRIRKAITKAGPNRVTHFAIRRYVDDFFIFANSTADLDIIEAAVRRELERYKLYVNAAKTNTFARPFVSAISIARRKISALLDELHDLFVDLDNQPIEEMRRKSRAVRQKMREVRLIVKEHDVGFENISGWMLSSIKVAIRKTRAALQRSPDIEHQEELALTLSALIEVAFYICSLDLRVRTTYSVCQIAALVAAIKFAHPSDHQDRISHLVMTELITLLGCRADTQLDDTRGDPVEIYNLLICGAQFVGADFVKSNAVRKCIDDILQARSITYFGYITAKFCYLKDPDEFFSALQLLNSRARTKLQSGYDHNDAELYLLLCDYLSAPDVAEADKRTLYAKLYPGSLTKKVLTVLPTHLGFVDWKGLKVEHLLARKELRPVYG